MTALRVVASNDQTDKSPKRKSLRAAFNDAALGKAPEQPHGVRELLLPEAFIGQETLKEMGEFLTECFPNSEFEVGPPKDFERAKKKKGDLAKNCDFSRARFYVDNIQQMRKAIDLFGSRQALTLVRGDSRMEFNIVDVDNTFANPNPKKPGLRNLDVKLLIPITLEAGEETFHVVELQFAFRRMKKALEVSHSHLEEARLHQSRKEVIEEAMSMVDKKTGAVYNRLKESYQDAIEKFNTAMANREKVNTKAAKQCSADALVGYQPCTPCNAETVARPYVPDYIRSVAP